jgi:RNA polymerase sigma factor (sigma-70 family)
MDDSLVLDDASASRFSVLLGRHVGIIHKIVATYCRDRDDRADLAQEITANAWQAFPRYDAARPFPTWLFRIALNVAISHVRSAVRRQGRHVPFDEEIHDTVAGHALNDALVIFGRAVAHLDPLNKALLVLYLDDYSHREIAEVLGISESNVGTKLSRLKERIRDELV